MGEHKYRREKDVMTESVGGKPGFRERPPSSRCLASTLSSSIVTSSDLSFLKTVKRIRSIEILSEIQEDNAHQGKRPSGSKDTRRKSKYYVPLMEGRNTIGMARGKGHSKRTLVDSPITLEARIEGYQVRRIYVDRGSSLEVMYEHCFRNLGPDKKAKLRDSRVPLVGFSREVNVNNKITITKDDPEVGEDKINA
ncbi:hypothetical protein Tco_0731767 [Tanacetum coccineum]